MELARQQGRTIRANGESGETLARLAVPIKVRGNVIAVLDTHKADAGSDWGPDEITLLETLADQLGAALEGARLYEDTQRRAAQELLIGEVTARLRASLDLETVLNTALDEIHRAMGLEQVTIHLATGATALGTTALGTTALGTTALSATGVERSTNGG
jgi:GAF domain-containing protein